MSLQSDARGPNINDAARWRRVLTSGTTLMKWLIAVLLVAVMVLGLMVNRSVLQPGSPAVEIAASQWFNTTGPLSLETLRGQIVVLEFWATWCPPCRDGIGHLNQLHDHWSNQGVVLIGLTDEPAAVVGPFVGKHAIRYAVGAGSATDRHYGVRAIPHAFVIDRAGQVVWSGYPDGGLDRAVRQVQAAAAR